MPTKVIENIPPIEIAYADDVDFIGLDDIDVENVQEVLKQRILLDNVDLSGFTKLLRKEASWRDTKKVGTLIGDKEDIERRKQLSTAAIYKQNRSALKEINSKELQKSNFTEHFLSQS